MPYKQENYQVIKYTFLDLSTFGGHISSAQAINNAGKIIGTDSTMDFSPPQIKGNTLFFAAEFATIWDTSYYVSKATLISGENASGNAMNMTGMVAGQSLTEVNGKYTMRATVWQNGETRIIDALNGDLSPSTASSVNDHGTVVGTSALFTNKTQAFIWNGTELSNLSTLGGSSNATAINNNEIAAGWAVDTSKIIGVTKAVIWKDGKILSLSAGDYSSSALDINDNDVVAGSSTGSDNLSHATVWDHDKEITLKSFSDKTSSIASAINNKNQVVGYEYHNFFDTRAVLWNSVDGYAIDLNQYLDQSLRDEGWVLTTASDINDQGSIVGSAYNARTHEVHGYVLTAENLTGLTGTAQAELVGIATPAPQEASADIWSI